MRVIYFSKYGRTSDLELRDIPDPEPKSDLVKVKIINASVNATDFEIVRGDPIVKLTSGFRRPKNWRLGCDFSGIVKAVGNEVTGFKEGDEVYADLMYQEPAYGAFAEYVLIPEKRLKLKPPEMSFSEASTYPQAGVLALQGIREPDPPKPGQKVLVNGAGGGVGTIAIQIAKHYGAEVTAVDSPEKFEKLQSIGADHCIDYRTEDFTKSGKYDVILDVIATRGPRAYSRALTDNGRYRMVGAPLRKILQIFLGGKIRSMRSSKSIGVLLGRPNDAKDLEYLTELYLKGVKPVIDRSFSLEEVPDAIQYLEDKKAIGKVVINVGSK